MRRELRSSRPANTKVCRDEFIRYRIAVCYVKSIYCYSKMTVTCRKLPYIHVQAIHAFVAYATTEILLCKKCYAKT